LALIFRVPQIANFKGQPVYAQTKLEFIQRNNFAQRFSFPEVLGVRKCDEGP
jgi:hypothetical protein